MNAEVYEVLEPKTAVEAQVFEAEREPSDEPCENKFGFIALCASCPLIAQFGGCPKEIREDFLASSQAVNEMTTDFLFVNDTQSYEFLLGAMDADIVGEAPDILQEDAPATNIEGVMQPTATNEVSDTNATPVELNEEIPKTAVVHGQNETIKPRRSYRDLLFDDTVEVVLAPQLTRRKQEVVKPINAPVFNTAEIAHETPAPYVQIVQVQEGKLQEEMLEVSDSTSEVEVIEKTAIELALDEAPEHSEEPTSDPVPELVELAKNNETKIKPDDKYEEVIIPSQPITAVSSAESAIVIKKSTIIQEQTVVSENNNWVETPQETASTTPFENSIEIELIEPTDEVFTNEAPADTVEEVQLQPESIISTIFTAEEVATDPQTEVQYINKNELDTDIELPVAPVTAHWHTPERLVNPTKPSKTKQSWSVSALFGSIALLKLVLIRVPR